MPDLAAQMLTPTGGFTIDGMMMRYNIFVPRLYNLCKSLGMAAGKIMPSRAFCSDENQGYPIIMIAKHFGTFPFNHGRVGGVVATNRNGPHAEHGENLVIIQASHVGYDPESKKFGAYKRLQTENHGMSDTCGKIYGVIDWYQSEYDFAAKNIFIEKKNNTVLISIDNHLLREDLNEGLGLHLHKLIKENEDKKFIAVELHSTAKTYVASDWLINKLKEKLNPGKKFAIGKNLSSEMFYYKHKIQPTLEGADHLELNLIQYMPLIITSAAPAMLAAQINTQVEFDRVFRTLVKEKGYQGKNLVFIAGLNIDISPKDEQIFPLTKFVPWAAYIQKADGQSYIMEQKELMIELEKQSTSNPDQIDLEAAIQKMQAAQEVKIDCCP
ncbi:MAG: hypothetical protein OEY89_09350 [Gammaproteobacteria bacterium]|nr:hypothetical protein [Gammaproteobacteria bacterium]